MKKLLFGLIVLLGAAGLEAGKYDYSSAVEKAKQVHSSDLAIRIAALEEILAALQAGQEGPESLRGLSVGLGPEYYALLEATSPGYKNKVLQDTFAFYLKMARTTIG
ncbi:MAG TPA: hypothetical protein VJJ83_02615 [Candidatus Babeliales bacterium]|nr:hypothetical protein [Candidatus Babeliales bacterium]